MTQRARPLLRAVPNRPSAHCHKMVADVAKAAAGELYEKLMGEDRYYSAWKKQNPDAGPKELERRFVAKNWGKCVELARATLALMLRGPIDNARKAEIHQALCLDNTLIRGRKIDPEILLPLEKQS